jgi:hypothetical protein
MIMLSSIQLIAMPAELARRSDKVAVRSGSVNWTSSMAAAKMKRIAIACIGHAVAGKAMRVKRPKAEACKRMSL